MPKFVAIRFAVRRLLVAAVFLAVAGCGGSAAASGPATSPSPTPGRVVTATDALDRVVANEPRLKGIQPFDSGLVGQGSWYTVQPASGVGVFVVTVHVGWGDCEAGCIDEHSWVYAIGPDGDVSAVSETGAPVPPDAWPSPVGAGQTGIVGSAVAGPVCPVERVPPDPACAARPVANATIVIRDASGTVVAQTITASDGSFFVAVPPGDYQMEPQPVAGLVGGAQPQAVTVREGAATSVQLEYDTGIR